MPTVTLANETDFEGWRSASRSLIVSGVKPEKIIWTTQNRPSLFADDRLPDSVNQDFSSFSVPRRFVDLARTVSLHCDPERFAMLYRLLWRLRDEQHLLDVSIDPEVSRAEAMAKSVRRDIHKMRAFVRFRRAETHDGEQFIAWFEPEHHITEANAPFFMRRFASMCWSIVTPEATASWDGECLSFSPGGRRSDAPPDDAMEDLWRDYYASIFNPARLKIGAMRAEMAMKYWKNLPEASLISPLIKDAARRSQEFVAEGPTPANAKPQRLQPMVSADVAAPGSLEELRAEAETCRSCALWQPATQIVFGEGPARAEVMFVGEQPGDHEDLEGRPFIGPAGEVFDSALKQVGIERTLAYVTNAVKHFKFQPRGKKRIHQRPSTGEIHKCRFWVEREIGLVQPRLIVMLGATAAHSIYGNARTISQSRGHIMDTPFAGSKGLVTVHPSYLLRLPEQDAVRERERFFSDLNIARQFLAGGG